LEDIVIVHVLRFRFKGGTSDEDYAACMAAFRAVGEMESVLLGVVGQYTGRESDTYTHSTTFAMADIEAFERYINDPAHRRADFIVHPHVINFDAFDTWDEDDPDLAAKIAAIQESRLRNDPELAKLAGH
jgi:hypothetical protein